MNCPVLLQYPDQFISNTKVVRNRSTNPDTQPTRVSDVHDTPCLIFPPPDTLSGNHPKLAVRPRINSRSEQYTVYRVRAPLTLCFPCVVFVLLALPCIYCFFPLLLLSGSPDDRCRCPCVRLLRRRRTYPDYRATRQAEPLPLSHIPPTFLYLSVALGISCC